MDSIKSNASQSSSTHSLAYIRTESDGNDLFHQYHSQFPSYDPELMNSMDQLCDGPTFQHNENNKPQHPLPHPFTHSLQESYFMPFLNATVWHLMGWFYNSLTQKSLKDLNGLVRNIILADNFDHKDLQDFSAQWETRDAAPKFHVKGLHYHKITEVIRSAFKEPAAQMFHTAPYKLFWQPDKTHLPERVITELYMANAMLQEHKNIKSLPVAGCNLETVIAAIMLLSDSTHLTSFSNAALWPIYLFLGNQSKYMHAKPTSFAAHHLTYIPKV